MKNCIYYFSETGNSLYTARKITEGLGNTTLVEITQAIDNKQEISLDTEKIGLIFPLYYLGLPEIVMRFIEKTSIPKNSYVFAVITRGFPPMGGAIKHLKKLLKKKNNKLDLGVYLDMPSNDLILFGTFADEKNQKILKEADIKLTEITSKIKSNESFYLAEPFAFLRPIRHSAFLKRLKHTDAYYWTKDTCNGCGICEKICPVKNIEMKNHKPIWKCQGICQECERCINLCPCEAIEYGKKTLGRPRYHNPNISLKDMID